MCQEKLNEAIMILNKNLQVRQEYLSLFAMLHITLIPDQEINIQNMNVELAA